MGDALAGLAGDAGEFVGSGGHVAQAPEERGHLFREIRGPHLLHGLRDQELLHLFWRLRVAVLVQAVAVADAVEVHALVRAGIAGRVGFPVTARSRLQFVLDQGLGSGEDADRLERARVQVLEAQRWIHERCLASHLGHDASTPMPQRTRVPRPLSCCRREG